MPPCRGGESERHNPLQPSDKEFIAGIQWRERIAAVFPSKFLQISSALAIVHLMDPGQPCA